MLLLLGITLSGCGEKREDTASCLDAPMVTWDNFGAGFVTENCQSCHASTATDRNGAPEQVTFDTAGQVWARAESVLARSAGDEPTMPPSGGTTGDDRQMLLWWLTCGEPGA